ncbi:hypothetical protein [Devriesea agamarum]|uniref:hypothetical protein n=1 Tax=Devriesea agamarum TaxID=472569 RepID=UPI00071D7BAC|nr:hypothetical protein [Devriesea agamarum]
MNTTVTRERDQHNRASTRRLRRLALETVLMVIGAMAVMVLVRLGGYAIEPAPLIALALSVAVGRWLVRNGTQRAAPAGWDQVDLDVDSRLEASKDVRVRRIEDILSSSRNLRRHASDDVEQLLLSITRETLHRRRGLSLPLGNDTPQDAPPYAPAPARHISDHLTVHRTGLSPGFLAYLGAAADPHRSAPRLDRRTLHQYLQEIDSL